MDDEQHASSTPKTIRLTPEEIAFLDEHDIKLSDLAHSSIEFKKQEKEKEIKKQTRQQKINKMVINGVFTSIGILFLWTLSRTNSNIIGTIIIAGIGICFTAVGAWGLMQGYKQEGMLNNIGRRKQP